MDVWGVDKTQLMRALGNMPFESNLKEIGFIKPEEEKVREV